MELPTHLQELKDNLVALKGKNAQFKVNNGFITKTNVITIVDSNDDFVDTLSVNDLILLLDTEDSKETHITSFYFKKSPHTNFKASHIDNLVGTFVEVLKEYSQYGEDFIEFIYINDETSYVHKKVDFDKDYTPIKYVTNEDKAEETDVITQAQINLAEAFNDFSVMYGVENFVHQKWNTVLDCLEHLNRVKFLENKLSSAELVAIAEREMAGMGSLEVTREIIRKFASGELVEKVNND